ncbi:hypothetical protein Tco_0506424 [Tanacetum coccineum]
MERMTGHSFLMRSFNGVANNFYRPDLKKAALARLSAIIVGETSERNSRSKAQCVHELDSASIGGSDLQPPFSSVGFSEVVKPSVGKVGIASGLSLAIPINNGCVANESSLDGHTLQANVEDFSVLLLLFQSCGNGSAATSMDEAAAYIALSSDGCIAHIGVSGDYAFSLDVHSQIYIQCSLEHNAGDGTFMDEPGFGVSTQLRRIWFVLVNGLEDTNPGRRFRSCSSSSCPIFSRIDPPMCARAVAIIPDFFVLLKVDPVEACVPACEAYVPTLAAAILVPTAILVPLTIDVLLVPVVLFGTDSFL